MPDDPLIRLGGIERTFRLGRDTTVPVLRGIDLNVAAGEFIALMGPSGSGKSTLMNILGLLDRPDAGTYHLAGRDVAGLDDATRSRERGRRIGFIFQSFNLIATLSVVDNVALPLFYQGIGASERRRRAVAGLEHVGLGHRLRHRPPQLSGGERQRVAIARALVGRPLLLMADEPTGNLDSRVGAEVMDLICGLHMQGLTVIMVTHDPGVAARAGRLVRMRDGRLEDSP